MYTLVNSPGIQTPLLQDKKFIFFNIFGKKFVEIESCGALIVIFKTHNFNGFSNFKLSFKKETKVAFSFNKNIFL